MILFMFIGGASGSTAGGIKVNTFVVILASISAAWKNQNNVIIRSKTIGGDLVNQAYLIFLFGIVLGSAGYLHSYPYRDGAPGNHSCLKRSPHLPQSACPSV